MFGASENGVRSRHPQTPALASSVHGGGPVGVPLKNGPSPAEASGRLVPSFSSAGRSGGPHDAAALTTAAETTAPTAPNPRATRGATTSFAKPAMLVQG